MSEKPSSAAAADPSEYDVLLTDARRLFGAVKAFRAASPAAAGAAARRLALRDELATLLEALRRAQGVLAEKLNRNARAAGAVRAYARGGATAPPRRG